MNQENELEEKIEDEEDLITNTSLKKRSGTRSIYQKRIVELESILEKHAGKKQLIVLKGSPDPDNIASSVAHNYISSHYGIQSTILYFEPISHQENRTLVKALEISLIRYEEGVDLKAFDCYSVLDSQSADFPVRNLLREDCFLLSFVDHHKNTLREKAEFVDIRENAGSCSSIYTEYIRYGSFPFVANDPKACRIATALMHGIRTDTDNFFLSRDIDFRAATYLSQFADNELLKIFATQKISSKTMQILSDALESKVIKDNFLIAGVGFVRPEDRDGIAQASDYLVRREGIDTAIVFGVVNDHIDASLRTSSQSLDLDLFIKSLVGYDAENRPYGGGRAEKGGFQIPLGLFYNCPDRSLLWNMIEKTICDMVFKKIGVTQEIPE